MSKQWTLTGFGAFVEKPPPTRPPPSGRSDAPPAVDTGRQRTRLRRAQRVLRVDRPSPGLRTLRQLLRLAVDDLNIRERGGPVPGDGGAGGGEDGGLDPAGPGLT